MKSLLIGCTALALIGGAPAFAQHHATGTHARSRTSAQANSTAMPPGSTASGPEATRADTGSAGVVAQNASGAALSDGTTGGSTATTGSLATTDGTITPGSTVGSGANGAVTNSDVSGQVVGDMAQSNPAPASYPICRTRHQDRCQEPSQAHHMARNMHRASRSRTGA